MRNSGLFFLALLCSAFLFWGCPDEDEGSGGDADTDGDTDTDSDTDTDADDTELEGTWHYSGGGGFSDTVVISNDVLTSDGEDWSATYDVVGYSNSLNQMELEVVEQTGTEEVVGDRIYMSYVLDGDSVDFYQEVNLDFPEASGGTEGVDYYSYTRE